MLKPRSDAQTADAVLMVRPLGFAFNEETAVTNSFMASSLDAELTALALDEFDQLERALSQAGVQVEVLEDQYAPDALFPNNWFSSHTDGSLILYPMAAPSRREERVPETLRARLNEGGFAASKVIDLTRHEQTGQYLEGTGSLVLDRFARVAFACRGPRTSETVLEEFKARAGYEAVVFDAIGPDGRPIYHTNVMMSLGSNFAVACLSCVPAEQRPTLVDAIETGGRALIEVEWEQLTRFACNILELRSRSGEPLVALSTAALASLRPDQRSLLQQLGGALVDAPIPTIEAVGGGGVRCMLAEIHLPRRA